MDTPKLKPSFTEDSVRQDIMSLDYGDPEIRAAYSKLYHLHAQKGLPYRELAGSKLFEGRLRYIVHREGRWVTVLDLDTKEELTWRLT